MSLWFSPGRVQRCIKKMVEPQEAPVTTISPLSSLVTALISQLSTNIFTLLFSSATSKKVGAQNHMTRWRQNSEGDI